MPRTARLTVNDLVREHPYSVLNKIIGQDLQVEQDKETRRKIPSS